MRRRAQSRRAGCRWPSARLGGSDHSQSVGTTVCRSCWAVNAAGSSFCAHCGQKLPPPPAGPPSPPDSDFFPLIRYYPGWVFLSLGVALTIAGLLLVVLYGIVAWSTSISGSPCGGGRAGCAGSIFQLVFLLPGAGLLITGVALVALVLSQSF